MTINNNDQRHTTANEHVRDAMLHELREYERLLGIAAAAPEYWLLNPELTQPVPPPSWWQTLRASWRAYAAYTIGDLAYLLVITAATGVVIGTAIASWWLV